MKPVPSPMGTGHLQPMEANMDSYREPDGDDGAGCLAIAIVAGIALAVAGYISTFYA